MGPSAHFFNITPFLSLSSRGCLFSREAPLVESLGFVWLKMGPSAPLFNITPFLILSSRGCLFSRGGWVDRVVWFSIVLNGAFGPIF